MAFKWGIIHFIILCGSRVIAQNIFLESARTKMYVRQCTPVKLCPNLSINIYYLMSDFDKPTFLPTQKLNVIYT